MFKLVIEDDEGNRTIVPVIRDEISIGRRKGNTIRLNERNVSRDHARLLRDDKVVFLEDCNSRYKTLCNGVPIDGKVKFNVGDVFSIGDYALSLQSDAVPEAAGIANALPAPVPVSSPPPLKKPEGTEIIITAPGKLVVTSSNFAGQSFALTKPEMLIGRGEECDIIIDHRSVSTRHAKVVRDAEGAYQIVDLDSKNGIKVSGEEYQSIRLKRGDTVEMGHVHFRFVEPGENYVFAPQATEYDDAFAGAPSSSSNKWLFPVIGLLFLLVIAAGYVVLGGDDSANNEPAYVEKVDNAATIETFIEKARTHIRKGEIDKAISKLDAAKMLTPNSGQTAVIEKMLSDAVIWSSLAKALDIGEDNFKAKRYDQALEKFKEISADTSTPIYQIMSEKGLPEQAIKELLKEAKLAKKEGRKQDSKRAVNAILLYDAEHSEAIQLNSKLGGVSLTPVAKTEVVEVPTKEELPKKTPVAKTNTKKKTKKKFQKDPKKAAEHEEKALNFLSHAKFQSAISECHKAGKHGAYSKCNRIYAVSYHRLGNTRKACKYYKRANIKPKGLTCD